MNRVRGKAALGQTAHHRSDACVAPDAPKPGLRPVTTAVYLASAVLASGLSFAPAVHAQPAAAAPAATPDATTLPALEVTGSAGPLPGGLTKPHPGGQMARGGSIGLLGTRDAMDTPFSTVNYTSELIENQQARTAADTLINDASVRLTTGSNGFDDTFQIRGFSVPSGDVGFNGMYGLVSSNRVPAQIIERIELLKGPGALINGIAPGGSIGGGINITSKRAGDVPFTRLTTLYQSNSNFGLHVDTGRRFGEDKAWGVRFNGLLRGGEASIDDGNVRTGLGALAVDYRGNACAGRSTPLLSATIRTISVRRSASFPPPRPSRRLPTPAATGIRTRRSSRRTRPSPPTSSST